MIKEIFESVVQMGNLALQPGGMLTVAMALVLLAVFKLKGIIEFIESRKRTRVLLIEKAMESGNIDSALKEHLKRQLNREYLYLIDGYRAGEKKREAIFKFLEGSNDTIPIMHFTRAKKFIQITNDQIVVEYDRWDVIRARGFNILGLFFTIPSLVILGRSVFITPASILDGVMILLHFFGLIVVGIVIFRESFPLDSAKIIEAEIERQNNEKEQ